MKTVQALFAVLVILLGLSGWCEANCRGACPLAISCLNEENIVWATDGQKCYVLRNGCYLKSFNCNRQNNCQEVLNVVPKEECQKLCSPICPQRYDPICAVYKNENKTFSSKCELDAYVCTTGELWGQLNSGECKEGNTNSY